MAVPAAVQDTLPTLATLLHRMCLLVDSYQAGLIPDEGMWERLQSGVLELVQGLLPLLQEIEKKDPQASTSRTSSPSSPTGKTSSPRTTPPRRRGEKDPYLNQVVRWYSRGRLKMGRVVSRVPAGHPVPPDLSQGRKMQCTAYSSQDRYLVEVYINEKDGYGLYSLPADRIPQCLVKDDHAFRVEKGGGVC